MKRIFIAINLPEDIKSEMKNLQKELQDLFPSESREVVKWVKKDNLHITLLFIGQASEEQILKVCEAVKKIAERQKSFSLKIEKALYGPPNKMPPRLIWLELEKQPEIIKLAENLKKEIANLSIQNRFETRSFSPHITLGRIKTWQWRKIEEEERPDIEREFNVQFKVKSVDVMESKLKRSGAEYRILESVIFY